MLSGAVAGLVAITPACGFVDPTGAFFIGLIAGNHSDDGEDMDDSDMDGTCCDDDGDHA